MSGNQLSELTTDIRLNTIEEAIKDIRVGKVIIVVDDEDRENEGDFICAAEMVTPEIINFMSIHGRGLICTPIDERRAKELELNMMVSDNTSLHETAFTVSIDLIGFGCTTGISAYDRATGIKALINPEIKASDFARPGHIFPLKAKSGGVLRRTGHTEAAIDLARMAGYYPAGVLVEILNEDGTMARLPQLVKIAEKFDLKIISIKDLVEYRMQSERIVIKEDLIPIETPYGSFDAHVFRQITTNDLHIAFTCGSWVEEEPVLVRVHSSTDSADLFDMVFKDTGLAFKSSLMKIREEGRGAVIFMRQSEKNVDIHTYLKYIANKSVGNAEIENTSSETQRDFGVGAQILVELGIGKIKLLTNNPKKRIGLIGYGLEIVENIEV